MTDKEIMEGILLTTKNACDLYLHGSIESATPQVHEAFTCALNDTIAMQNGVYAAMQSRGWYPAQQAQAQSIAQVRQKYAAQG